MKQVLVVSLVGLVFPVFALAAVNQTVVEQQYAVVALEPDPVTTQYWLGELLGDPIMYELVVDSTSTVAISLFQNRTEEPIPYGLLVVRRDDRGGAVTEVARFRTRDEGWGELEDEQFRLPMLTTNPLRPTIGPGTYRIEVSTPVNEGKFLLAVGTTPPSVGYFEALRDAISVHRHFGYSGASLIFSSFVLYPLGIIVLLGLLYLTWRYRNKIAHVG